MSWNAGANGHRACPWKVLWWEGDLSTLPSPHTVSATLTNSHACLHLALPQCKRSERQEQPGKVRMCSLKNAWKRYPDKEERWRWAYCDVRLWECSKQVKHVLRKEGCGEGSKVLHQKIGVQWPLFMIFLMRLPLNLKSSGVQCRL